MKVLTARDEALRIAKNAFSGAGSRIATMTIGFGLTPFIVHALGLQQYGMWAVVGSLAGYLGLLDFGLGGTFVKFLSEFVEKGHEARARQVMTFGMMFYVGFGLILAIPVAFAGPHIVRLFKMPADQYAGATNIFYVLFGLLIVAMVLGVPGAAIVAKHRMDLASRNNLFGYFAYAIATVILVRLGFGVWGVIGGQFVQIVVSCTLQWISARRVFGPLWHHPLQIERNIMRRMLGFGGWTQLTSILNIVSLDAGRFISAGVVGVTSVSYYELGSKLAFFSNSMPAYLLDAIMPSAAAADAREDTEAIDRLYVNGTIYLMFATMGLAGFISSAANPIIHIWLGTLYPYIGGIVVLLGIGYAISGLTGVGTTVLRAAGRPDVESYFTGVAATVNVASTAFLVHFYGILGVAGGAALGRIAGTVYFLVRFHTIRKTSWPKTIGFRVLRLVAANAIAVAFAAYTISLPIIAHCFDSRFTGLLVVAIIGLAYSVIYGAMSVVFGVWGAGDTLLFRRAAYQGIERTSRFLRVTRGGAA